MTLTFTRKRVEILADSALLPRLVEASVKVGINGHSVIPVASGAGRGGPWRDDRLSGSGKLIFLTFASEEKARALTRLLAPHLDGWGMILTMADVEVVRPEHF